jgi:hypothetical protein
MVYEGARGRLDSLTSGSACLPLSNFFSYLGVQAVLRDGRGWEGEGGRFLIGESWLSVDLPPHCQLCSHPSKTKTTAWVIQVQVTRWLLYHNLKVLGGHWTVTREAAQSLPASQVLREEVGDKMDRTH